MRSVSQQILEAIGNDSDNYTTFSVRITKKHYDILQELSDITGQKPATLARTCLQVAVEDLYATLLTPPES
jgi:predicted DNA-binding protein